MMMMGASTGVAHSYYCITRSGRVEGGEGVREPTADRSLISMRSSSDTHVERVMFARTCVCMSRRGRVRVYKSGQ